MAADRPSSDPANEPAIALVAPDLNGTLRTRHLPAGHFDPANTPCFADIVFAFDASDQLIPRPSGFTGWWPSWDDGFGDLSTEPDLSSRRPIGWRAGYDVVFADLTHRNGTPVAVAPRQVLRRVVRDLDTESVTTRVGTELEFFLADVATRPAPGNGPPAPDLVYAFAPLQRDHTAIEEIVACLAASDIGVDSWYTEGGPRQYEIALAPTDPLRAADNASLARCAIEELSIRHGLRASFAPKPGPGYGNGLHVHTSLYDQHGTNLLRQVDSEPASRIGGHALAGALAVLRPATAMLTPNPNGYHRLAPHTAAGTTATWAHDNRTAGIRYLDRADQSRFETRTAASDANPYLVVAALLAGIAHGVRNAVPLPPPGTGDVYTSTSPGSALPGDLASAVRLLQEDPILNDGLGRDLVAHYAATRRWAADLTHRLA